MYYILLTKKNDALAAEMRQNINLANTLAEQSLRVFESADQAMRRVNDALASNTFVNEDLARFTRETGLAETIITQLSYVGADGKFIASNLDINGSKTGKVDLSERAHIKIHLSNATTESGNCGLFIGQALVGKVSGKRTIQLSRKLQSPDGTVKGVVVASLNPDYFEINFKGVELGALGQVAIMGDDGFVRAGVKGGQSDTNTNATAFWRNQISSSAISKKPVAVIASGNEQVVFASKQVGTYPIYLVVQTSMEHALDGWQDTRNIAYGITTLFSLALFFAAGAYLMGIEKLELTNRGLEGRVRERTKELSTALDDLRSTQSQLIAAEKMASLGLLVSNVAHEINTPIGAVKSSGALIADSLEAPWQNCPGCLTC